MARSIRTATRSPARRSTPAILTASLVAALACACQSSGEAAAAKAQKPPRKAPPTVAVESVSFPKTLSYVGTLVAPRDATLSSTRGGRVDAYYFDIGKTVPAGAVLVKLGSEELGYASQAAAANVVQARARIGDAKDAAALPSVLAAKSAVDLSIDARTRAEQLHSTGSLSDQELNRLRSNEASARAQYAVALSAAQADFAALQQTQATSAQANAALNDKIVRAPFAGVVLDRFVEVGQIAAPNAPLLRVLDPSELRVRFEVPQFDANKVKLGGGLRLLIAGQTLIANVVRSTPGLVGLANARLVEAKVQLPEGADDALRSQLLPGSHVPIWLEIEGSDEVVIIPRSATTSTAGLSRAWVVEDNHLSERLLTVLRFEGDKVLVRGGIAKGERVVQAPAADFRIGEEVAP